MLSKADQTAILSTKSTVDDSGNFYVGVNFYDTLRAGNVELAGTGMSGKWQDIGIIKYGNNGAPQWALQSTNQPDLFLQGLQVDKDYNIHVIVYANSNFINFGGSQASTDTSGTIYRIIIRPDGSVLNIQPLATQGKAGGLTAIPLYRLASDGRTGLLFTSFNKNAVVAGDTLKSDSASWFLAAFDQMGQKMWGVKGGEAPSFFPGSMEVGSHGSIYISYSFLGDLITEAGDTLVNRTLSGGADVGVSSYSDDGNFRWTKSLSGAASERMRILHVGEGGEFYASLDNYLSATWDGTQNITTVADNVLVKINDSGEIQQVLPFLGSNVFIADAEGFKGDKLLITGSYEDTLNVQGSFLSGYPQNFSGFRKGFLAVVDTLLRVSKLLPLKSDKYVIVGPVEVTSEDYIYLHGAFYNNLELASSELQWTDKWGNYIWKTCLEEITAIKEPEAKRYVSKKEALHCVPNPAVFTTSIAVPDGQFSALDVYDITGRPVKHIPQPKAVSCSIPLEVGGLPAGIYTILITTEDNHTYYGRFVKGGRR